MTWTPRSTNSAAYCDSVIVDAKPDGDVGTRKRRERFGLTIASATARVFRQKLGRDHTHGGV